MPKYFLVCQYLRKLSLVKLAALCAVRRLRPRPGTLEGLCYTPGPDTLLTPGPDTLLTPGPDTLLTPGPDTLICGEHLHGASGAEWVLHFNGWG